MRHSRLLLDSSLVVVLVGASCALTPAARALAQRTVILVPRIEPVLSEADRALLQQTLEGALRAEGAEPVTANETTPCNDADCERKALDSTQSKLSVQLTVWKPAGTDESIGGVGCAITDESGNRFGEGAKVLQPSGQALAAAVTSAIHGAWTRMRRGPGPWLEVEGEPTGAFVEVDGQRVGTLPGRYRVTGGLHHIVVGEAGFEVMDATVTVPRNLDASKLVQVQLKPSDEVESDSATFSADVIDRPSPLNYAIAAGAVAAGALLAIRPIRTGLDEGECGRIEDGRCTGVVRLDALTAAQLGLSAVLIAGGATVALWCPLRVRVESTSMAIELPVRY